MAEIRSKDDGDDNDAVAGDVKRKVGCEDEVDNDDGNDNDNGGVDDHGSVEINDGTDANDGEAVSITGGDDANDDNSNDDGGVDGNGVLGNDVLVGKVVMRLMMVTSKLRVLQVTLVNVMEVLKWK